MKKATESSMEIEENRTYMDLSFSRAPKKNHEAMAQIGMRGYDMLTRNDLTTTGPIERKLVMTRFFDAPRKLIFKAFIDPNLLPLWWGPKRLTTSIVKMDVRPGGIWRFVQRDSDGNEYVFNGMYHEIVPPKRLVYTFEFEGMPGHVVVETVTFEEEEEHGGKTKLTSKSFFQTAEDRDIMLNLRVGAGMAARMDRLAELLKEIRSTDEQ